MLCALKDATTTFHSPHGFSASAAPDVDAEIVGIKSSNAIGRDVDAAGATGTIGPFETLR